MCLYVEAQWFVSCVCAVCWESTLTSCVHLCVSVCLSVCCPCRMIECCIYSQISHLKKTKRERAEHSLVPCDVFSPVKVSAVRTGSPWSFSHSWCAVWDISESLSRLCSSNGLRKEKCLFLFVSSAVVSATFHAGHPLIFLFTPNKSRTERITFCASEGFFTGESHHPQVLKTAHV